MADMLKKDGAQKYFKNKIKPPQAKIHLNMKEDVIKFVNGSTALIIISQFRSKPTDKVIESMFAQIKLWMRHNLVLISWLLSFLCLQFMVCGQILSGPNATRRTIWYKMYICQIKFMMLWWTHWWMVIRYYYLTAFICRFKTPIKLYYLSERLKDILSVCHRQPEDSWGCLHGVWIGVYGFKFQKNTTNSDPTPFTQQAILMVIDERWGLSIPPPAGSDNGAFKYLKACKSKIEDAHVSGRNWKRSLIN